MGSKILQRDHAYAMQTNIKKWGNSHGIRLSKELLAQMDLQENDSVKINICNGKMTVEKINKPKYPNP